MFNNKSFISRLFNRSAQAIKNLAPIKSSYSATQSLVTRSVSTLNNQSMTIVTNKLRPNSLRSGHPTSSYNPIQNLRVRTFGYSPIKNSNDVRLWPKGRVPYTIDLASYDAVSQATVQQQVDLAVQEWNRYFLVFHGVYLVPRNPTTDSNFILFADDDGTCHTHVGKKGGEQQVGCDLDLTSGSFNWGSLVHEIGHAIGLYHEQQRCDRDTSIQVSSEDATNYGIEADGVLYGEYDLASIMHYSEGDHDGNHIRVHPVEMLPATQRYQLDHLRRRGLSVGQRSGLSYGDLETIAKLYAPSRWNLRFLVTDLDGDGRKEIVVVDSTGERLSILREQGGQLHTGWVVYNWVNQPGANPVNLSGSNGWNLRRGDQFIPADINGDLRQEIIVISPDGEWIGILQEQTGRLEAGWIGHDWVNSPGRSGNEGWNLRKGDQFIPADINGDGRQEIIVISPDGEWIGILQENGGKLQASWIGHGWVNSPGRSGNEGWNLRKGDQFIVADVNGDGRQEIIVISPDGEWIGILQENGGKLQASWIGHDWVNSPGQSGNEGWNLRKGDQFIVADINGDRRQELIVSSPDGEWLGILQEKAGKLQVSWIGHDWVNSASGTGNEGWNLRKGDQFIAADINADGCKEIIVFSPNKDWMGILREQGGKLNATGIRQNWITYPNSGGNTGWQLRRNDQFMVVDLNGDRREELLVRSSDGLRIGLLREYKDQLYLEWMRRQYGRFEHSCIASQWNRMLNYTSLELAPAALGNDSPAKPEAVGVKPR